MPKCKYLHIQPQGILRLSTALVLAGGSMMLTQCERSESTQNNRLEQESIQERARAQSELDSARRALESGMVENNYNIPRVGYYHAAVGTFYETQYNQEKDDRFFVNGQWQDQKGPMDVPASRPTVAELARIEAIMSTIQAEEAVGSGGNGGSSQVVHHHGGSGFMNGMMMYWLLSGNRNAGYYSPGPGFTRASAYTSDWQRKYQDERAASVASRPSGTSYGARSSGTTSSSSSWGTTRPSSSSSSSSSPSSAPSQSHAGSSSSGSSSGSHASSSSGGGDSSGSSHSSSPSSRGGFGSSSHGSSSS